MLRPNIVANDPTKRPKSVTFVALSVLTVALINVWRAVGLANQREMLLQLNASFDPRIQFGIALLWALIFFTLAALLWWRRPQPHHLRRSIPIAFAAYMLYQHVQTLLFTATRIAPLLSVFNVMLLVALIWALRKTDQQTVNPIR